MGHAKSVEEKRRWNFDDNKLDLVFVLARRKLIMENQSKKSWRTLKVESAREIWQKLRHSRRISI